MITRDPPRPPVRLLTLGAPVKLYVKFDQVPPSIVVIPDNCQPSRTPFAMTLLPRKRLAPGIIKL